jgi:endoglucanase
MKRHISVFVLPLLMGFIFMSCKDSEVVTPNPVIPDPIFKIAPDSLKFPEAGGNNTLTVTMNGSGWSVLSDQSWCTVSANTSSKASDQIVVTTTANTVASMRTAKLTFVMDYKTVVYVRVIQSAKTGLYQSYKDSVAPDAIGMGSTAMQLAAKIKVGINIGNTMEATGGETAWGNPLITNELVTAIKQNGFNAIRIPCSWDQYTDQSTAKISATWLNRVKQVVQYCVSNDMYVILNIHWDGGWLENNCTEAKKNANNAKQKAYWEQIATTLRDFDEHVLFASANEPNVSDAIQMAVLMSYHQTFVNAIRSTGGKNAYRVLVVQGPSTDIEKTNQLMTTMPTDKVANKMMAEVHYYTPWNFCGMTEDATWGNQFYYWGTSDHSTTDTAHNPTWGEESTVDANFALMKKQFVDKGIPVVIGEFGAITRTNLTGDALKLHLASRAYYFKYVSKQAIANGCLPFFWDTGGLINRNNYSVSDQQALDGLIQGATN